MRSDLIKEGVEKTPHRAILKALGVTDSEMHRPFIAVVCAASDYVPGHMHLHEISKAVKDGIRNAGGVPFEFFTIGVCDGLAMNHKGMRYSLASRELIADSIEVMLTAHPLDGVVFIPNCDKIVPGMVLAASRMNLPAIFCSGGPMNRRMRSMSSSGRPMPRSAYCTERMTPSEVSITVPSRSKITQSYLRLMSAPLPPPLSSIIY